MEITSQGEREREREWESKRRNYYFYYDEASQRLLRRKRLEHQLKRNVTLLLFIFTILYFNLASVFTILCIYISNPIQMWFSSFFFFLLAMMMMMMMWRWFALLCPNDVFFSSGGKSFQWDVRPHGLFPIVGRKLTSKFFSFAVKSFGEWMINWLKMDSHLNSTEWIIIIIIF